MKAIELTEKDGKAFLDEDKSLHKLFLEKNIKSNNGHGPILSEGFKPEETLDIGFHRFIKENEDIASKITAEDAVRLMKLFAYRMHLFGDLYANRFNCDIPFEDKVFIKHHCTCSIVASTVKEIYGGYFEPKSGTELKITIQPNHDTFLDNLSASALTLSMNGAELVKHDFLNNFNLNVYVKLTNEPKHKDKGIVTNHPITPSTLISGIKEAIQKFEKGLEENFEGDK